MARRIAVLAAALALAACAARTGPGAVTAPPPMAGLPQTSAWTQAAFQAVAPLSLSARVPADAAAFCPAYGAAGQDERKAFFTALLLDLAKPSATNANLLGISPAQARQAGCAADALSNPEANFACGARLLDQAIRRDNLIAGWQDGGWRGAARVWPSLRDREKLADLQAHTAGQRFCARRRA